MLLMEYPAFGENVIVFDEPSTTDDDEVTEQLESAEVVTEYDCCTVIVIETVKPVLYLAVSEGVKVAVITDVPALLGSAVEPDMAKTELEADIYENSPAVFTLGAVKVNESASTRTDRLLQVSTGLPFSRVKESSRALSPG